MPFDDPAAPGSPPASALIRAGTLLLACLASAGCFVVFDPGERVETPSVSGTLRAEGAALPSVEVWVTSVQDSGDCGSPGASTRTGDDGTFQLAESRVKRNFEVVPLAPSTPRYTVRVCMDRGVGPEPLFTQTFMGALPLHVSLDCDLDRVPGDGPACDATLAGRQSPGWNGID